MGEIVIFDTEFTAWDGSMDRRWSGPGEWKEIIQIGAIIFDSASGRETAQFDILVKPVRNPILSEYIVALTGITQTRLEQGGSTLSLAVGSFLDFAGSRPLVCYGRDDRVIFENFALLDVAAAPFFEAHDIKPWLENNGLDCRRLHAGALAKALGSAKYFKAHDAVEDARSIGEAIRICMERGAFHPLAVEGPALTVPGAP
jgi:inhibitor of KinA sporulation pathway (predicted exonuclease)